MLLHIDVVVEVIGVSAFAQLLAMSTLQYLVSLCLSTEESPIEVNGLCSRPLLLSLLIVAPEKLLLIIRRFGCVIGSRRLGIGHSVQSVT